MVDRDAREISVLQQAALLEINRSSLYYHPMFRDQGEVVLKNKIDEIYTKRRYYGSRRIAIELARAGLIVNCKAREATNGMRGRRVG